MLTTSHFSKFRASRLAASVAKSTAKNNGQDSKIKFKELCSRAKSRIRGKNPRSLRYSWTIHLTTILEFRFHKRCSIGPLFWRRYIGIRAERICSCKVLRPMTTGEDETFSGIFTCTSPHNRSSGNSSFALRKRFRTSVYRSVSLRSNKVSSRSIFPQGWFSESNCPRGFLDPPKLNTEEGACMAWLMSENWPPEFFQRPNIMLVGNCLPLFARDQTSRSKEKALGSETVNWGTSRLAYASAQSIRGYISLITCTKLSMRHRLMPSPSFKSPGPVSFFWRYDCQAEPEDTPLAGTDIAMESTLVRGSAFSSTILVWECVRNIIAIISATLAAERVGNWDKTSFKLATFSITVKPRSASKSLALFPADRALISEFKFSTLLEWLTLESTPPAPAL
mmetsp:Transcript_13754/g.26654  ORF Transcript_13754/g.26654 Transcript_13754/m.26654 type:complete len:394 (-) Transcript_13754:666-1847(-)